jgi:hypothetical protein
MRIAQEPIRLAGFYVAGLLCVGGHDSEAHHGDALVLVAGSASPLGGGWVTTSYMS